MIEPIYTWGLALISIMGYVFMIMKRREGFELWIIANAGWMCIDYVHKIYSQAFLYFVFLILAIIGRITWRKNGRNDTNS